MLGFQGFDVLFNKISNILGRYDETTGSVEPLIRLLDLPAGAKILDLPCGFGRFSQPLHKAGFQVVGVDISAGQIKRAEKDFPGPEYIVGDMRTPAKSKFDAMINLYSSFGYFESVQEDFETLKTWHNNLKKGGILVMELSDIERARFRLKQNKPTVRHTDGVCEELWVNWDTNVLIVKYIYKNEELTLTTRLYKKSDLEDMLQRAGFVGIETYGGVDKRPKTPNDRLVVRAVCSGSA